MKLRNYFSPLVAFLFLFISLYSIISLVNHYCFRTYALDLGISTSAIYDYAHFQAASTDSFSAKNENLLAGHFDLILPFISFFGYLFGSLTLLIFQIFAIIFGGYGIYNYFKSEQKIAFSAMLLFFIFAGTLTSISYDYHSNVIAACLIPWLFVTLNTRKIKAFVVFFFLIILSRETFSLLMITLLPAIYFIEKKNSLSYKKLFISLWIISLFYFIAINVYIMPTLSEGGKMYQFRYSVLGSNYFEALQNVLLHPVKYFNLLFYNETGIEKYDGIKVETWLIFLFSGGIMLFIRPLFLFILLPVFAQKMFHNQPEMWGINDHYAIEFAPFLAIGVFKIISTIQLSEKLKILLIGIILLLTIGCSIRVMDNPLSLIRKDNIRIYKSTHYTSKANINSFYKISKLIPVNAKLCCQSSLHPHFAWRDYIYLFPNVKDAEYILLNRKLETYPSNKIEFLKFTDSLSNSPNWNVLINENDFLLLKKH